MQLITGALYCTQIYESAITHCNIFMVEYVNSGQLKNYQIEWVYLRLKPFTGGKMKLPPGADPVDASTQYNRIA